MLLLLLLALRCSSARSAQVLDWSHVSSVNVGIDGNYLITARNLDTVVSVAKSSAASFLDDAAADSKPSVQWVLSSTLTSLSNFTFENDNARFFEPHDVSQLPNGDVLFIDDGDDRPGCKDKGAASGDDDDDGDGAVFSGAYDYSGCFSRAVQYELDFDAGVARLRWQFEFPRTLNASVTSSHAAASAGAAAASGADDDGGGYDHFVADGADDLAPSAASDLREVGLLWLSGSFSLALSLSLSRSLALSLSLSLSLCPGLQSRRKCLYVFTDVWSRTET